jgi:hypothetical protein
MKKCPTTVEGHVCSTRQASRRGDSGFSEALQILFLVPPGGLREGLSRTTPVIFDGFRSHRAKSKSKGRQRSRNPHGRIDFCHDFSPLCRRAREGNGICHCFRHASSLGLQRQR